MDIAIAKNKLLPNPLTSKKKANNVFSKILLRSQQLKTFPNSDQKEQILNSLPKQYRYLYF